MLTDILATHTLACAAAVFTALCAANGQDHGAIDPRTGMSAKQARRDAFRQVDQ